MAITLLKQTIKYFYWVVLSQILSDLLKLKVYINKQFEIFFEKHFDASIFRKLPYDIVTMRIISLRKNLRLIDYSEYFDILSNVLNHLSFEIALPHWMEIFKLYLVEVDQFYDVEKEDNHTIFWEDLALTFHVDLF